MPSRIQVAARLRRISSSAAICRLIAASPPVSSRKTSSSEARWGASSDTAMPASTSALLTSAALPVSTATSRCAVDVATSANRRSRRAASASGSARTRSRARPRRSSTVPSAISRPARITPTRSLTCSISPIRWLESSTVRPPCASALMNARISAMPAGSSPLVGSSRISSSGSLSSAAATPSRCFIPIEYAAVRSPARAVRSTSARTDSTRAGATPAWPASTRRLSRPDRYG